jgi:hypothetical protein
MKTKYNKSKKTYRNKTSKRGKSKNGKWTTAIEAAQSTLSKTGSLTKAHLALKKQALFNARKLFGSVKI